MNRLLPRVLVFLLATLFLVACVYVEKSGAMEWTRINHEPELIANVDGLLVFADKMGGAYCKEFNFGVD